MEFKQTEEPAIMLHATLHIMAKMPAILCCDGSAVFVLPDAECFEHLAEGEYQGIFELVPLQPCQYKKGKEIMPASQAVVIDYHLETPEAVKESPGFMTRFLEGFVEGWNAPPPEQRQRRNRKHL
jgi:hypothetical protein